MNDTLSRINLILRELGVTRSGQVGKDILAQMVLEKVNNPIATYEEICEAVKKKNIVSNIDVSKQKGYVVAKAKGLSDEEFAVLYVIEGVESHNSSENGKQIIEKYIDKVYRKYLKSQDYEEIVKKVLSLGLAPDNTGVNLMISMMYKYQLSPDITEIEMYEYLLEKCKPEAVVNELNKASKEPVEIIAGSNLEQPRKEKKDIIKDGIDSLIMEAAKESQILSVLDNPKQIIEVIINI